MVFSHTIIATLGISLLGSTVHGDRTRNGTDAFDYLDCASDMKVFDPRVHKRKYRLGVHAIRGFEATFSEYNATFSEYLSATAGRRFDPPIEFEMVPVTFQGLFDAVEEEEIDFFFANPGIYSCVGVEQGAQPLATVISRLEVRGHTYDLDVYGGVIFTQAENDDINSVRDLHDKVIGAGGISVIMGGQSEMHEMEVAGLSYVMDPKQMVFTGNQIDVVNGVINGEFDAGFVRTDQIERTMDTKGNPLDPDIFKIIEPKIQVLDDGTIFPFLHSTPTIPEWPVAALSHVPMDVSEEVQRALLAMEAHAEAGRDFRGGEAWAPKRCDTTVELAELALNASLTGHIAGFRTARSYFEVRTMHQAAGFMLQDARGNWKCTRAATLYDSIKCPAQHYKVPFDEYESLCANAGLQCREGYDCYCRPCIKAFEVDVFQWDNNEITNTVSGCEKMSLCGSVEQTKLITFHAIDNIQRSGATLRVTMNLAQEKYDLTVVEIAPSLFEFTWSNNEVGVGVMEIYIDDEQIPESPIRVQVVERNCELEYPGKDRTNSANGGCVCRDGYHDVGGKCVGSNILATVISLIVVIFVSFIGYGILRYKTRMADQVWQVNVDELHFDDPPEVIGQGSFGVVLLATYRGTRCAIKRAAKSASSRRHSKRRLSKSLGSTGKDGGSSMDESASLGVASVDTSDQSPENSEQRDLEIGEMVAHSKGNKSAGATTTDQFSLGFLAEDFGPNSKWTWLFPWLKKQDNRSRFRDVILGTNSASYSKKSLLVQMFPCLNSKAREEEELISEMRVLSRLRHPCITTVMGAVISHFHEPMLVMEYMEYGSLYDLLRNETMHLSGEVIMQVARDIAQGLRYLHSSKPPILHGDLKARNILVDSRFRAKLCDFGLSTKNKNLIAGTPFWLAPEYLRGQTAYNPSCDIFSIGIILYEIYARKNPYEGEHFRETLRKICDRRVNKRPPVPPTCPPKMADLMKKCWSPDPFFRPQAKDLDTLLMDMNMQDAEPLQPDDHLPHPERTTGDMLYELFPRHIADALKAGKKVEPEQHELVTVIFSDIVHFTDISREITPLKVSNMLDRLYLAFDKIARKHGVFKVETIGDAYMGVTNLVENQEDTHVKRAAEFAVDMIFEASQILIDEEDPEKGYINIRVGFHSGPVVSNVIGSLNPRYGLFGDTVNTASRMESNSKANRILCSERAFHLLEVQAPQMPVSKRGKIPVKGKGDMTVYWVGRDRSHAAAAARGLEGIARSLRALDSQPSMNSEGEHRVNPQIPATALSSSDHVAFDFLSDEEAAVSAPTANHKTERRVFAPIPTVHVPVRSTSIPEEEQEPVTEDNNNPIVATNVPEPARESFLDEDGQSAPEKLVVTIGGEREHGGEEITIVSADDVMALYSS